MEFVQKFTPPDFQAKNFTPSISPNFNSFNDKNTKKWVKMEKLTPLAKILHCGRQWRHWQIPPLLSVHVSSPFVKSVEHLTQALRHKNFSKESHVIFWPFPILGKQLWTLICLNKMNRKKKFHDKRFNRREIIERRPETAEERRAAFVSSIPN